MLRKGYGEHHATPVYSFLAVPEMWSHDSPRWGRLSTRARYSWKRVQKHRLWRSRTQPQSDDSDDDFEPMDPEELAALNAIINTRRSMASAQNLAAQMELYYDKDGAAHTDSTGSASQSTQPSSTRRITFAPLPMPVLDSDSNHSSDREEEYGEAAQLERSASLGSRSDGDGQRRSRVRRSLSRLMGTRAASLSPIRAEALEDAPEVEAEPPLSAEEERLRRRKLIRAQRPGGTGMVTLLDGARIRARQVGDVKNENEDGEDFDPRLWGFAALERQRALIAQEDAQTIPKQSDAASEPRHAPRSETPSLQAPGTQPHCVDAARTEADAQQQRRERSAAKAQELQRRHEDEVRALGSEAMARLRRERGADVRRSRSTSQSLRVSPDPRVSLPSPSPLLPRRPDAIGISVVPLEHLGVRPSRPYEGRSWLFSLPLEDDDSDEEAPAARKAMQPESTQQRQRKTTRAAEQEVVHGRRRTGLSRPHNDSPWDDEFWPRPSATRKIDPAPQWPPPSAAPKG